MAPNKARTSSSAAYKFTMGSGGAIAAGSAVASAAAPYMTAMGAVL